MSPLPLALLVLQTTAPSALEQLADAVTVAARAAHAEAPLGVSVAAPAEPALQQAFSTALLARLDAAGLSPELLSADDAESAARAHGCRTLLRVHLRLSGTLSAAGDVVSTWVNFFSAASSRSAPRPSSVVFAEVAPDALVRALSRPHGPAALVLVLAPLASWPVRTAALATGDLALDGGTEVAVLTEEAVEVRALDGRLLAQRSLEALPRAELPSREAFGTLSICGGLLYAFSASRAVGEVLALENGALKVRSTLQQPVVACGPPLGEATLLPGMARLVPSGKGWPALSVTPYAWGLAARKSGSGTLALVLREDGTASTAESAGPVHTLSGIGAGAALLDVLGDGVLRLAASSALPASPVDRLRILDVADGVEHGAVEVPGRILQVAAAPSVHGGPEAVLLGVWREHGGAELRLVRSTP